ncbi:hypothetical protein I4641_12865 [Waterburya agarophytonicola K14]|uniref:Uncharacterized protein n=1 Tax=Waterburya agarophytonicola KI4 TaxID=2874699 RepID=A0A964FHS9_9CYAN|nr:DUF6464 family protein [Waterburya agarophytonicola]MCC0177869.1 hypothetical protein [Waterburya agarophytonicola KI4]
MTTYFSAFVIKLALILLLSILPSLVYLLIFRKAKKRWQMRLRRAQVATSYQPERFSGSLYSHNRNLDLGDRRRPVTKYFIGDTSCINNAQSPYIRCAINPEGPCDECSHFEKR